jgi:hypothetical protein
MILCMCGPCREWQCVFKCWTCAKLDIRVTLSICGAHRSEVLRSSLHGVFTADSPRTG